jgi:hypothetical protein
MEYGNVQDAVAETGLLVRGGFHPVAEDGVPGGPETVVLVGNAGPSMWDAFADATGPGDREEGPNPLDDWTRRVLAPVVGALGARALYPFEGPPYLPFQSWALRTGGVHVSPIGPLIDPEFGLWHAYRGALAFDEPIALPETGHLSPCDGCAEKPCLGACPVKAFTPSDEGMAEYDIPACIGHISSAAGEDCLGGSCLARRACPVGRDYVYGPDQSWFHMQRFVKAQGG